MIDCGCDVFGQSQYLVLGTFERETDGDLYIYHESSTSKHIDIFSYVYRGALRLFHGPTQSISFLC